MNATRRQFITTVSGVAFSRGSRANTWDVTDDDVARLLLPIRDKYRIPALAGAVVGLEGVIAKGAVGVRKAGDDTVVSASDLWHLGSNTKAMTATLAAIGIESGKLAWESTLGQMFPGDAALHRTPFAAVTLAHLLAHRAGLPHDVPWRKMRDRDAVVTAMAKLKPLSAPGETFAYSNVGYVLAGHMIEAALGDTWENLIRARIFKPLGMADAGFGGTGTSGKIDQPWPHGADGKPMPKNGPATDNPAVMAPAGTVHASLQAWGRFVADQLAGAAGKGSLLKPEGYKRLHTPGFGGDYANGWAVTERAWGGGEVLTHAGSNTMNKSVAWLAPLRGFAVIVCTNQGGEVTTKACDEAAAVLIKSRAAA